jgi:hypothetical protein
MQLANDRVKITLFCASEWLICMWDRSTAVGKRAAWLFVSCERQIWRRLFEDGRRSWGVDRLGMSGRREYL